MASHPKFSLRAQASIRDEIEARRLVKFLQDYAVKGRKNRVEPARVTAALGLLKKCIPDLAHTSISNPDGSNIQWPVPQHPLER